MTGETLMNWMLHTGLDVSLLILLVLICRRPFIRFFGARAAYSLWALPLIRLILPDMTLNIIPSAWLEPTPSLAGNIPEFSGLESFVPAPETSASLSSVNWHIPVIFVWLGIASVWLGINLWQQYKYTLLLKQNSETVTPNMREKVNVAVKSLSLTQKFQVRMSQGNIGPLVTGIVRPLVILPSDFEQTFNQDQQIFALTHELAHIKRRDLWAAFAGVVFRALNWPNPLVHYVAAKFRTDQEAACDAFVLDTIGGGANTKQTYVATLIHSAKLHQTRTGKAQPVNPLCLTIHHPLKERLMTLKSSNPNTGIFPRLGLASFLIAALAATAPLTLAASPDNAPQVKSKIKKVFKLVENENGIESEKTYEIITEDGVTTAYSIDEHGNKTVVNLDEVEALSGGMMGGSDILVWSENGKLGNKHIQLMLSSNMDQMPHGLHMDGTHSKLLIKRLSKGSNGRNFEIDSNVFVMGGGSHASAMVSAAQDLLGRASNMDGDQEHSTKVKRKLDKARKALKEAKEALEAEEG